MQDRRILTSTDSACLAERYVNAWGFVAVRPWFLCLPAAVICLLGCELVVSEQDLSGARCTEAMSNVIGPPACIEGEMCDGRLCVPCPGGVCPKAVDASDEDRSAEGSVSLEGASEPPIDVGREDHSQPPADVRSDVLEAATDEDRLVLVDVADAHDEKADGINGSDVLDAEEASHEADTAVEGDTETGLDAAGDGQLGGSCNTTKDCESGLFCTEDGQSEFLGPNVCTKKCCNLEDCPAGFVCLPGYGANICVSKSSPDLPVLGETPPGKTCSSSGNCSSGRCNLGTCSRPCCTDDECDPYSLHCGQDSVGLGVPALRCMVGGTSYGQVGDTCGGAGQGDDWCHSRMCLENDAGAMVCTKTCCGNSDCSSIGAKYCSYVMREGVPIHACMYKSTDQPKACCTDADCSGSETCQLGEVYIQDDVAPASAWVLHCK